MPEGFVYRENIVSPEEESRLIENVRGLPFREFEFQNYRGKRRVVSFGLHYDFAQSKLQPADEYRPSFCRYAKARRGLPASPPMICRTSSSQNIRSALRSVGIGIGRSSAT